MPAHVQKYPRALLLLLALVALLALLTFNGGCALSAAPDASFQLQFPLQETHLDADRAARLAEFATPAAIKDRYVLVQGFACDTGGFEVSLRVARQRAAAIAQALRTQGSSLRIADAQAVVLHGTDREAYRRGEVHLFRSQRAFESALLEANRQARLANQQTVAALAGEAARPAPEFVTPDDATRRQLYFVLALLAILFVIALFWMYLTRRPATNPHQLDEEEAAALEILTGGAVTPLPPAEDSETTETVAARRAGGRKRSRSRQSASENETIASSALRASGGKTIQEFIRKARNQNMGAKKKSKAKISPISIRGAVDRDFEGHSLGELARAPIHALEGLTPRHARMLEEAFDVKTVEDLARLKYVEIARAIVVLSRFEK